jgi:histidinol dehydrogenase
MRLVKVQNAAQLKRFLKLMEASSHSSPAEVAKVARVLAEVRSKGDKALLGYVRRFDGFQAKNASQLRVSKAEIQGAYARVGRGFVKALETVKANIQAFQKPLKASSWRRHLRPGVLLGQRVRPLKRAGLYVPGGQAPLVSTVLMTAVPAKVAGVAELALCTPNRGGGLDPRLIVAADLSGVTEIYQIGGAQAIAAMAYGTASLKRVEKIAGPGSRWVNLAKKQVYGDVGIDSLAGPSEAMVVADDSARPAYVAADLLSQAEHAGDETAILVTPSLALAKAVLKELQIQLKALPRRAVAAQSLKKHGLVAVVKNIWMALDIVNARGPEHLQLMLRGAENYLPRIQSAGAIFLGTNTPVALGDFVAGPSHVLPTGSTARFMSGLSVEDFMTKSSIIGYSAQALAEVEPDLLEIARAEGLEGHARSVSIRTAMKKGTKP